MPKKFLEAGKIVGTHGVRGDLKVQSWCDSPEVLCDFDTLYLDEKTPVTVEKAQVQQIVESFMESIKDSLTANKNVYLRGFGSFIVKRRAEKVARNISKNTTITIPAHNIPAFKPAKSFAGKVKTHTK